VGGLLRTGQTEADGGIGLVTFQGTEGVPQGSEKVGIASVPPHSGANLLAAAAAAKRGNPGCPEGTMFGSQHFVSSSQVFADQTDVPTVDLNSSHLKASRT